MSLKRDKQLEQGSAQTIATFTGTLLRRERNEAKGLVQLVFREAGKNWLCLSSDQQTAELPVGKVYAIEGEFKQIGDRSFIHEPNIAPLVREVKKRRWWIGVAIGLGFLLVACGVVFAADKVYTKPVQHQKASAVSQTASTDTSGDQSVGDTSPDPADTTATTNDDTTTSPLSSTLVTSTTNQNSTPPSTGTTQAPATTTTPDCDAMVTTPYTTSTVEDDSQPVGSSQITTPGQNGETQTCYPNGRSQPGQTSVIQVEQDEVITIGPPDTTPPDSGN